MGRIEGVVIRNVVLFIPWTEGESPEQTAKCEKWKSYINSRRDDQRYVTIVHHKSNQQELMSELGDYDQVYVRGHCDAGSNEISEDKTGKKMIDSVKLCSRLKKAGLQAAWKGKLKFWNCSSGSDMKIVFFNLKSFAHRCAVLLRGDEFQCQFIGYTQTLQPYYMQDEGEIHRFAISTTFFGKKDLAGRAKNFQVSIDPTAPH